MLTRRRLLAASIAPLGGCLGAVERTRSGCGPTLGTDADARLGFVGDVMLGRNVDDYRSDRPRASVWGSTIDRLQRLDGLFLNLECCLSDRGERRPGRTYYFRADPDWAVPALDAGGVCWAGLANNHVLDYGPVALGDTVDSLDAAGIAHAGAGPDLGAAIGPAFVEVGGLEVAVIALTDQSPTYAAGASTPGTAYASLERRDPLTRLLVERAMGHVAEADPDLVVASLHWGPNWEVTPAAEQRAFARWLIERGVDLVHGHSAHVVQGVEVYAGRPIVYDAGDFVDDYAVKPDLHNDRSFLFELRVTEGRLDALDLVPVEIADRAVHRADGPAASWLRERMRSLSAEFGTAFDRRGQGLSLRLGTC